MEKRSEKVRWGYRFGFNGQEKDDEIFGAVGTAMGSEFCEYDTRTGRRWNMDPYAVRMPTISPYSYALNNPIMLKDPEGDLPIIPWLLKAGASAGSDVLLQASMIYLTDDNVETFGQALSKVDKTDVAISFLEGLNPFKVPGGVMGEAALVGFSDVIIGAGKRSLAGEENTAETIAQDFFVGFFSQLAGHKANELLSNRKVREKLSKILGKEDLGIIYKRIDKSGNIEKPYVGKAKSPERFEARQKEHARDYPDSDFEFEIIDRGSDKGRFPTDLDRKEQRALNSMGGPTNKSNPNGGTSNKKNVIKATF